MENIAPSERPAVARATRVRTVRPVRFAARLPVDPIPFPAPPSDPSNPSEQTDRFIYDVLRGTGLDRDAAVHRAIRLGLDLGPPRAAILIDAAAYVRSEAVNPVHPGSDAVPGEIGAIPEVVRRRSQLVIGSVVGFFHLPNDTICATNGAGEVVVLKASDSKNLETWIDSADGPQPAGPSWANLAALKRAGRALLTRLRHDTGATVTIGIGRYHPGVDGLARSYDDARAALRLGRRVHGQNAVHCLDGLGVAAFVGVADERTKIDLARHLLSPLDQEPDLIATLETFLEADCRPSVVARRLGIHRNTLGYRLDKVATLTGLDPRRFDAAVQIRLALVLRSLDEG